MILKMLFLVIFTISVQGEVASCCTTWNADCYLTASAENYNHACSAVEHCDGLCSSLSAKSGDLAAYFSCQECCQQYDHEVAWNCPKLEKASCCTTWNAECYTTASPANHDWACVSSGVMGSVHCGSDCADVLSTECEECCTGLSWHENDWNCELEDEAEEEEATSTLTCQYVAIDSSECLPEWECYANSDEYFAATFDEGDHYDYDCSGIGECPMEPNDAFVGMICEADAKDYMKGNSPTKGEASDLTDRPAGTKADEDNCNSKDVYVVECTSTLDIEYFNCNYVAVAEEDCNEDWSCVNDYDEDPDYPEEDCDAIAQCPMYIDDMSLEGMFCEADANHDGDRPEGTSADLNNCKNFDVYEVVCVEATCEDGKQNQNEEDVDCGGPCDACVTTPEAATDPCSEYEKKPCRKEHFDVCKWSHVLKECQSIDWTPVCSDYTLYMLECKKFSNEGYACEWKNKECKATDVEHECFVGWKEAEVLKGKSDKTKHKHLATLQDCQDKAVEVGAEGFIYEENHKKQICLTFDTVNDYNPGTSADTELQIYYHETC